jgi:hypothetical protein
MSERVGAIKKADAETVWFYGFGVYQGETVPPENIGGMFSRLGIPSPTILLDNGYTVYGCECWWSSENEVKQIIGDRAVVTVSPPNCQS